MSDMWTGMEATHNSPYYPFRKVIDADTLAGMEQIPFILCRYLMDMPDGTGYTPPSDNSFPRARLKKLLYWDGTRPLDKPLPTAEQMKKLLFDPENPDKPQDTERGYRIFPQNTVFQSLAESKSLVRVYLSDASNWERNGQFITRQDIIFDVVVDVGIESNTGMTASSRSYDIVQAIQESVAGVNFGGAGPMTMRSIRKINDERYFLGYKMYFYMDWNGSSPNQYFS